MTLKESIVGNESWSTEDTSEFRLRRFLEAAVDSVVVSCELVPVAADELEEVPASVVGMVVAELAVFPFEDATVVGEGVMLAVVSPVTAVAIVEFVVDIVLIGKPLVVVVVVVSAVFSPVAPVATGGLVVVVVTVPEVFSPVTAAAVVGFVADAVPIGKLAVVVVVVVLAVFSLVTAVVVVRVVADTLLIGKVVFIAVGKVVVVVVNKGVAFTFRETRAQSIHRLLPQHWLLVWMRSTILCESASFW